MEAVCPNVIIRSDCRSYYLFWAGLHFIIIKTKKLNGVSVLLHMEASHRWSMRRFYISSPIDKVVFGECPKLNSFLLTHDIVA